MQKNHRSGRLGEEIKKIISEMMLRDLRDPRIHSLTSVSAVEVTEDNSYATVYLTVMGTEDEKKETVKAFSSAAGFIRRDIGKKIKIRHVPELSFKIDSSLDYGMHISKLIDEISKEAVKGDEGEKDE